VAVGRRAFEKTFITDRARNLVTGGATSFWESLVAIWLPSLRPRSLKRNRLVPEMPAAGEEHRHAMLVAGGDDFGIVSGSTGLDDGCDP
jgi:hypothetical protein